MQMLLDRERANQLRAGRRLEYFTLSWNLTEAAVADRRGQLFAREHCVIGFGIRHRSFRKFVRREFRCGACNKKLKTDENRERTRRTV